MTELLWRTLRRLKNATESSFTTAGTARGHYYAALTHPAPRS